MISRLRHLAPSIGPIPLLASAGRAIARRLRRAAPRAAAIWTTAIVWIVAAQAWGAGPSATGPAATGPEEKNYIKSYAVVLLGCMLGLLIVCRSSHRTSDVKFEDDKDD